MVKPACAVCRKPIREGETRRRCLQTDVWAPEDRGEVGNSGSAHARCYKQLAARRRAWRDALENMPQTRAAAAAQAAVPARPAPKPTASKVEQLRQGAGGLQGALGQAVVANTRLGVGGSTAGARPPLVPVSGQQEHGQQGQAEQEGNEEQEGKEEQEQQQEQQQDEQLPPQREQPLPQLQPPKPAGATPMIWSPTGLLTVSSPADGGGGNVGSSSPAENTPAGKHPLPVQHPSAG